MSAGVVYLQSGDIISLSEENFGYLSCSSWNHEPIPEAKERISHLRAASTFTSAADLWDQSMFRLKLVQTSEATQSNDVLFGSIVQLYHDPTKYILSGSNTPQLLPSDGSITDSNSFCVFLGHDPLHGDVLCSKWQITSRFKIRRDGEQVRSDDYIILKNLRYKDHVLMPFGKLGFNSEASLSNMVVIHPQAGPLISHPPYWRIQLLRRSCKTGCLCYGDYVRITSAESQNKHLISRLDDNNDLCSKVVPTGLSCLKLINETRHSNSYDVFIREVIENGVIGSGDSLAYGLWQILPDEKTTFPLSNVHVNSSVLLKHALSGKLLAFRKSSSYPEEFRGALTNEYSYNCVFKIRNVDVDIDNNTTSVLKTDAVYFEHASSETLLILDAKIPIQKLNDNNSDDNDLAQSWWEYLNDVPFSSEVLDLDSSAVYAAMGNINVVSRSIVKEFLYVKRFLPIFIESIKRLQQPAIASTDIPVFRHLFNSILALSQWVAGDINDDAVILNSSKTPSVSNTTSLSNDVSSLAFWIFNNNPAYLSAKYNSSQSQGGSKYAEYQRGHLASRFENGSLRSRYSIMTRRRKLLQDCRILDLLQYFVQIIHFVQNAFDNEKSVSSSNEYSITSTESQIPPLVFDCCTAAQDLLYISSADNVYFSSRLVSLSGNLLNLINQKVSGRWDPPIGVILASCDSLLQKTDGLTVQQSKLLNLIHQSIDAADIRHIVSYMQSLRVKNDDRAFQILSVLSSISYSGRYSNPKFQQQILISISSLKGLSTYFQGGNKYQCPPNALLSTRYNSSSHGLEWELCSTSNYVTLFDDSISYGDSGNFGEGSLVYEELHYMASLFHEELYDDRYSYSDAFTTAASTSIVNVRTFLIAQGFGLSALKTESKFLEGVDFWQIWRWWYGRRKFYFPSDRKMPSALETMSILGSKFHDIVPNFPTNMSDFTNSIDQSVSSSVQWSLHSQNDNFLYKSPIRAKYETVNDGLKKEEKTYDISKAEPLQDLYVSWNEVFSEVTSSSLLTAYDRKWIRMSLLLVISLSRNKNIYAQIFGSSLLPIECIVQILTSQKLDYSTKQLLFEYILCVFIDSDFVFNTGFHSNSKFLSLINMNKLSISNDLLTAGVLFNRRSQYIFLEGKPEQELARELWFVFVKEIEELSFSGGISDGSIKEYRNFAVTLLEVLKHLNRIDFFSNTNANYLFPESNDFILLEKGLELVPGYVWEPSALTCGDFDVNSLCNAPKYHRFSYKDLGAIILKKLSSFYENTANTKIIDENDKINLSLTVPTSLSSLVRGYTPVNLTDKILNETNGDVEGIAAENAQSYFESVFSDTLIMSMATQSLLILLDIYSRQLSEYTLEVAYKCLDPSNRFKHDSVGNENNLSILIKKSKLKKIISTSIYDSTTLRKINSALVNSFLLKDTDCLHSSASDLLYDIANVEGRAFMTVANILSRVNVVDSDIYGSKEGEIVDTQKYVCLLNQIVQKFAIEYVSGASSSGSLALLTLRADMLASSIRFLQSAYSSPENNQPKRSRQTDKRNSLESRASFYDKPITPIHEQSNLLNDESSFDIELTAKRASSESVGSISGSPKAQTDAFPYSLKYEFLYEQSIYPVVMADVTLSEINTCVETVVHALKSCLKKPIRKERFAFPVAAADAPLSVLKGTHFDKSMTRESSPNNNLEVSSPQRSIESPDQHKLNVRYDKSQSISEALIHLQVVETFCSMLFGCSRISNAVAVSYYNCVLGLITGYLSLTNSLAIEVTVVLSPFKVMDLLSLYAEVAVFDSSLVDEIKAHFDRTINRIMQWFSSGNDQISINDFEIKHWTQLFKLIARLCGGPHLDNIRSSLLKHSQGIFIVVVPRLLSEDISTDRGLGYASLYSAIVEVSIKLFLSYEDYPYLDLLNTTTFKSTCTAILSNSGNIYPLAVKSQLSYVSSILFDQTMSLEKYTYTELNNIERHLEGVGLPIDWVSSQDDLSMGLEQANEPKYICIESCKNYIIYGIVNALLWRVMLSESYFATEEVLLNALKATDDIKPLVSDYMSKLSNKVLFSKKMYQASTAARVSPEYISCIRKFFKILSTYRAEFRIFQTEEYLGDSLKEVYLNVCHLYVVAKHILKSSNTGHSESILEEILYLESSDLNILDHTASFLRKSLLNQNSLPSLKVTSIKIVDKLESSFNSFLSTPSNPIIEESDVQDEEAEVIESDSNDEAKKTKPRSSLIAISQDDDEYNFKVSSSKRENSKKEQKIIVRKNLSSKIYVVISTVNSGRLQISDELTMVKFIFDKLNRAAKYAFAQANAKSLNELALAQGSPYEKYIGGGTRFIQHLVEYLILKADDRNVTTLSLMEMLIDFLKDNVNQYRSQSATTISERNTRVQNEIDRVQRLQNQLSRCNVTTLIADKIINYRSEANSLSSNSTDKLFVVALRLGTAVMSWGNKVTQRAIMDSLILLPGSSTSITANKPRSSPIPLHLNSITALQEITRGLKYQVENIADSIKDNDIEYLLPDVVHTFNFFKALCGGSNESAKLFLIGRNNDYPASLQVNILESLVDLVNSLLTAVLNLIHYIDYEPFNSQLAPLIWPELSNDRRQFISWHNPNNNFPLLIKLLKTISAGYDMLVNINGQQTQDAMKSLTSASPKLLKFVGLLSLRAESVKPSNSSFFQNSSVQYFGGDPFKFYSVYVKELTGIGALDAEPDCKIVSKIGLQLSLKSRTEKAAIMNRIWGIERSDLINAGLECEKNCLRLMTSMISNSQSIEFSKAMIGLFNAPILFQNMSSYYMVAHSNEKQSDNVSKEEYNEVAVLYITLLSDFSNVSNVIAKALDEWQTRTLSNALLHKSQIASIEVINKNGALQRVYFPIPTQISTYWGYPEVQKVKENTLLTVNRNSPEEKIADLIKQSNGLELVMLRQRGLRLTLGPFHAIIGGETLISNTSFEFLLRIFPSQHVILVAVTVFFNIYFVYVDSTTPAYQFPEGKNPVAKEIRDAIVGHVIYYLQYFHLALSGLITIRSVLNSRAADSVKPFIYQSLVDLTTQKSMNEKSETSDDVSATNTKRASLIISNPISYAIIALIDSVIVVLRAIIQLLTASIREIALFFFSFLGLNVSTLFYALCLTDLVFVFDTLKFLIIALSTNIIRIAFTVLMAIICLYYFAIIDYQFFQDQYALNGHYGCKTILSCLKLHVDYGLNTSPNWVTSDGFIESEVMSPQGYSYFGNSVLAVAAERILGTILNIAFIVIVNLVLQAIIQGIIVDTFSSMRQAREDVENDIKSNCFICSIAKDDFEKAHVSFRKHVREEHNMWKYLWYRVYLENKDALSFSAVERHSYESIKAEGQFVKLFPIKKALSLQRAKES